MTGLFVLGAVFLTVTGAEALTADMGHFGLAPIRLGWFFLVFPALTLNYLGQGAYALSALEAAAAAQLPFTNQDWFFLMAPDSFRPALVLLATLATIIASQAVITGAYSLTQQAIQLGLLPRLRIRQTSAAHSGQIYLPAINWLLLVGVLVLVIQFRTSSAMAAAYGIAGHRDDGRHHLPCLYRRQALLELVASRCGCSDPALSHARPDLLRRQHPACR